VQGSDAFRRVVERIFLATGEDSRFITQEEFQDGFPRVSWVYALVSAEPIASGLDKHDIPGANSHRGQLRQGYFWPA